jgi:hypothetical protein
VHEQTADEWGILLRNLFALSGQDIAKAVCIVGDQRRFVAVLKDPADPAPGLQVSGKDQNCYRSRYKCDLLKPLLLTTLPTMIKALRCMPAFSTRSAISPSFPTRTLWSGQVA